MGYRLGTVKSPEVSGSIRETLDQTGLKGVSVSQDRDKGIVIIGGKVEVRTISQKQNYLQNRLSVLRLSQPGLP